MNQKKLGILLSYINLIMSMAVNIFLTPFLIYSLGDVDYSLYKVIHSFAGPLSMFHLGISTIVIRSIVRYKNLPEYSEKEKSNTIALSLIVSAILSTIIFVVALVMHRLIPIMYGDSYTLESIELGQRIFLIFVGSTVLHMLTDTFSGCLVGHEKFAISSLFPIIKTGFRAVFWVVCLKLGGGLVSIAMIDLISASLIFVFSVLYSVLKLREIPKLSCIDKTQIFEILSFGVAIFLQAFVNQVNNNVDVMILGVYVENKEIITMYSSALAIYGIYNSLVSSISSFFLPQATKLVTMNASGKEITDFVIKPGRFQAAIAVACVSGFALFGKNFITIWIGSSYQEAYWIIIALMVPVTVPLVENAMISILDASLKRIYRSTVLVIMAIINVIVSIILVKIIGFWGAAIGTVLSLILGHGFLMNYYYSKTFNLEIGRTFRSIFKGILPAGAISSGICIPLSLYLPNTFLMFVVKCISFLIIYLIFLWVMGFTSAEKKMITDTFKKTVGLFSKLKGEPNEQIK